MDGMNTTLGGFGMVFSGISIVSVIIGLVQLAREFGLRGNWLRGLAAALGLLLGIGYQIAVRGAPEVFADWFFLILFGLSGAVSSGLVDFARAIKNGNGG